MLFPKLHARLKRIEAYLNQRAPQRRRTRRGRAGNAAMPAAIERLEERTLLSSTELLFVDSSIWNHDSLPAELLQSVDEVIVLEGNSDGIGQMAQYLDGRSGISAIHVLSHGDVGVISPLGNSNLNLGNVTDYSAELATIGQALTAEGDILLWGCAVAGLDGTDFVQLVAGATGADVAASTDLTGTPNLGGNWVLEYSTGAIEANDPFESYNPEIVLTHFRSGSLTWQTTTGNTVQFRLEQSWRRSFFGNPNVGAVVNVGPFNFGDGTSQSVLLAVQSVDVANDSFTGTAVLNRTYASPGNRIAFFESAARLSNLRNNADGTYRTETLVNVGSANDSPLSSLPPIVQVADNNMVQFVVPASDPNGDSLSFRLATSAEAGGFVQPPGLSINATTGLVTWDIRDSVLSTIPGHLWSAQVMVVDSHGAKTPVDFLIRIASATNQAPVFDSIPSTISVVAGTPLTFSVQASDPDSGVPVSLQALTPPSGMTFTPATRPPGSPASATRLNVAWTPPLSAAGTNIVLNFVATDNLGVTSFRAVTISVTNQTPVANNDSYSMLEDFVLSIPAVNGVLVNDNDPDVGNPSNIDGDGLPDYLDSHPNAAGGFNIGFDGMVALVSAAPTNGALTLNKNGSFTYTPALNFHGTDSFTYVANDGFGNSSPATVTIVVAPVSDVPTLAAHNASVIVDEGTTATNSGTFFDGDLNDSVLITSSIGTVTQDAGNAGSWIWELPAIDNLSTTTVTISATDSSGAVASITFGLTVENVAPQLDNLAVTSPINENGFATLTGDIIDPGTQDTFTLQVDWGDGTGIQTYNLPAGSTTLSGVTHQYRDDNPSGTAFDVYNVRIISFEDDDGGMTGSDVGGNIFLTGHDVLLHGHQNGYDAVILDYLRGAGTSLEIARADYDILYLRQSDRGVPGGTGPGFNASQFGNVIERDPLSFSSAAEFASVLSTVDVVYIPWILDISATGSARINSFAPQFEAFINAGGDVAAESSSTNSTFYNFLPPSAAATGASIGGSTGFTATAAGTAIGITNAMINGFATHNRFDSFDSDFTVFETRGSEVISIGIRNAVIDGGSLGSALAVTVNNVAPIFDAGPDETILPPQVGALSRTINFSDPGTLDVHQVTVDYGDGSPGTLMLPIGDRSFNLGHIYLTDGTYTVSVTIEDDDLGTITDTFEVTVILNTPPVANAGGPYSIGEGSSLALDASGSTDAQNNITSYTWDLDNDGQFDDATGVAPSISASTLAALGLGDDGTYSIAVLVTDSFGTSDTAVSTITVNNVPPQLENVAITSAINENGFATLTGNIIDPGTRDTFTLQVNWGDGSVVETFTYAAGTTSFSETHQYMDDEPTGTASDSFSIGLTISDDDGGTDSTSSTSVVINSLSGDVANTDFNSATTAVFGRIVATQLNFATAGYAHSHSFSTPVDVFVEVHNPDTGLWSEVYRQTIAGGTTFGFNGLTVSFAAQAVDRVRLGSNPQQNQTYHNWGSLALTVEGTASPTISINNVAPALMLNPVATINENGVATLTGTISDPGTLDTFTLDINWGDPLSANNIETYTFNASATGSQTFTLTHQYRDDNPSGTSGDTYTISAIVTDDDTGSASATQHVTINNVAPTLVLDPVAMINEDGVATLSGTITDPGTLDTFTLTVNWGDPLSPNNVETYTFGASASGSQSFTLTHQYLDDNPSGTLSDNYAISVMLSDDDGAGGPAGPVHEVEPNDTLATAQNIDGAGWSLNFDGDIGDTTTNTSTSIPHVTIYGTGNNTVDFYSFTADAGDRAIFDVDYGMPDFDPWLSLYNAAGTILAQSDDASTTWGQAGSVHSFDSYLEYTFGASGQYFIAVGRFPSLQPIPTGADYRLQVSLENHAVSGGVTATANVTVNNLAPVVASVDLSQTTINENGSVTVSGNVSDLGSLDTHTVTIDFGDGSAPVIVAVDPATRTYSATHQYLDDDADDQHTISVTATDDDGGISASAMQTISMLNVDPVVTSVDLSQTTINEDGTVTVSGTVSDVGSLDTHTVEIDFGDGSAPVSVVVDPVTRTYSATHQYLDDDVDDQYTISVTATDDDAGISATATAMITVNNVAPLADPLVLSSTVIDENGTVTVSGTFTDPGTLDTHEVVINWGDGSTNTVINLTGGARSFSATHQYLDDNPTGDPSNTYTISATVADDDTGSDSASAAITVNNVAPLADPLVLSSAVIDENGTVTVNGTFTDPGTLDTHEVVINWGDGSANTVINLTGGARSFSATHQYLDDNGSGTLSDIYTITATVTDDDTGVGSASAAIIVNNVAPTITAISNPQSIDENQSVTVRGTFSDPAFGVATETFTGTALWSDGVTTAVAVAGNTFSTTRFFADDDPTATLTDLFNVSVTITDDDLGSDSATAQVTINNVAPTLVLNPVAAIDENGVATLTGTITDPGTRDTFTLDINWGDPLSPNNVETYTFPASGTGTQTFTLTHQYLDDNGSGTAGDSYTISANITDDDTGADATSTSVTVNNLDPVIVSVNAPVINEDGTATISGSFTDVGTLDTHTVVIDWGDGTTSNAVVDAVNRTFTADHQYLDDNPTGTLSDLYAIRVVLTDDDTGTDSASTTVTVNNVDPANVSFENVTFGTPISSPNVGGVRGQTLEFLGAFTDVGTLDTHSATVNWGDGTGIESLSLAQGSGAATISGSHIYTTAGTFTITVTVTDDDGGVADELFQVTIANAALLPDTCHEGQMALFVGGTTSADDIQVIPNGNAGQIEVRMNGVSEGTFAPTGRIVVFGQAGDDNIQIAGSITNSAWLYGGGGDDRLKGGAGHDVLLGEADDDLIVGGSGRDLLVGGHGSDRIVGNADDDILIAGWLDFPDRDQALCDIMHEWTSGNDYLTRIRDLEGTLVLGGTVKDADEDRDTLTGSAGDDWFFLDFDNDKATDLKDEVFASDLDWITNVI